MVRSLLIALTALSLTAVAQLGTIWFLMRVQRLQEERLTLLEQVVYRGGATHVQFAVPFDSMQGACVRCCRNGD
jgi:hypothetical protein